MTNIDDIVKELAKSEGAKRVRSKPVKKTVMRVRKSGKSSQKTKKFVKRYFIDKFKVNGGTEYEIFTITVPKETAKSKKALLSKVNKVVR